LRFDRSQEGGLLEGYLAKDGRGEVVGRIYENQEAERVSNSRSRSWSKITVSLGRHWIPKHITLQNIEDIAKILGVDLDEPTSSI
jgi:hypothetical protein